MKNAADRYADEPRGGWIKTALIVHNVNSHPVCRDAMRAYVEGEMLRDADGWPQSVPLQFV